MSETPTTQQQQDRQMIFHPSNIMLFFLLAGLSFLFLALTVSYVYTRTTMNVAPVKLPWLFLFNTLILLGSSYTMMQAKKCYIQDNTAGYQQQLKYTIFLSVLFMLLQGLAWYLLFTDNVLLNSSTTTAYLYVISFVHLAHVVAGLPFLILFYYRAKKHMIDPVTVLIYFSDPEKRLRLRLLTVYWHFLDVLWIYLVLFFAVNMLV